MTIVRTRVANHRGLHARAAARFVRDASRFSSHIEVASPWRRVDGKSILGLLLLAATAGTELVITADGPDEVDASAALAALVEQGFGEL